MSVDAQSALIHWTDGDDRILVDGGYFVRLEDGSVTAHACEVVIDLRTKRPTPHPAYVIAQHAYVPVRMLAHPERHPWRPGVWIAWEQCGPMQGSHPSTEREKEARRA